MSISKLIGIPYWLGGATLNGADCWGLAVLAFAQERGIELPAYNLSLGGKTVPPRGFVRDAREIEQARAWFPIGRELAEPLDVVLLRNMRAADHVGVVTEYPHLILTTDRATGSHLCEWGPSSFWGQRVEGVFRYALT